MRFVLVACLLLTTPGLGAEEPSYEVIEVRPADGEQCIVCGRRIDGGTVVEIRYRGRTAWVKSSMADDLAADPEKYLRAIEARAALFDERATLPGASNGWLAVGVLAVLGLVCASLTGITAIRYDEAPLPWFFAGLVGSLAALLVQHVAFRQSTPRPDWRASRTAVPRICPSCGTEHHPAARRCLRCGLELAAATTSEVAATGLPRGGRG